MTIIANGNFTGTKTVQYTVVPDTSAIAGLTTGNATSANEDAIKAVVAQIEAADETLPDWDTILADCKDMLTRISEIRTENNRIADAADGYTLDSVKSTDKEALAQIAADAQTLLNGGNLTVVEKKALEEIKAKAEGLLKTIEEADKSAGTTSPGTGDKSDISGLFAFMFGSMAAVFGILFGKKREEE